MWCRMPRSNFKINSTKGEMLHTMMGHAPRKTCEIAVCMLFTSLSFSKTLVLALGYVWSIMLVTYGHSRGEP